MNSGGSGKEEIEAVRALSGKRGVRNYVLASVVKVFQKAVWHISAIALWSYILVNSFGFNVDQLLKSVAPQWLSILIDFKFFVFCGLVLVGVLVWRPLFVRFVVFWLFYPAVLVAKFVAFVFRGRRWMLAISTINFLMLIGASLVRVSCVGLIAVLAWGAVTFSGSAYINSIGMMLAIGLVVAQVWWVAAVAGKQDLIIRKYLKIVPGVEGKFAEVAFNLPEKLKGRSLLELNEDEKASYFSKLQLSLAVGRGAYFLADLLRQYNEGEWRVLPTLFAVVAIIVGNVFFSRLPIKAFMEWTLRSLRWSVVIGFLILCTILFRIRFSAPYRRSRRAEIFPNFCSSHRVFTWYW